MRRQFDVTLTLTEHRHHLWLLTLDDKLFLAPVEDPQSILDVGTGTGLWAVYSTTFPISNYPPLTNYP